MPESLEVRGLNISPWAACGVWDHLFFANLCLGGKMQMQPAALEIPDKSWQASVVRKYHGGKCRVLCFQQCKSPSAPRRRSTSTIVTALLKKFPPGIHSSSHCTYLSIPLSSPWKSFSYAPCAERNYANGARTETTYVEVTWCGIQGCES